MCNTFTCMGVYIYIEIYTQSRGRRGSVGGEYGPTGAKLQGNLFSLRLGFRVQGIWSLFEKFGIVAT